MPARHSAESPGQTLFPEWEERDSAEQKTGEILRVTMPGSPGQGLSPPQSSNTSISAHAQHPRGLAGRELLYPDSKTIMNDLVLSGKGTLLSL